MPPPRRPEPISFEQWVREVFGSPTTIPREVLAIIKQEHENNIYMLVSKRGPSPQVGDREIVRALIEGPEAFSDLKYVNNAFTLKDLGSDPIRTIEKLVQKTKNDILSLDEISQDRRAELLGRLVRGQTTDGDDIAVPNSKYTDVGQSLDDPDSLFLKPFRAAIEKASPLVLNPVTGRKESEAQLLIDKTNGADPNNRGVWEDRRTVEQSESDRYQYKTYASLAAGLATLGSNLESPGARITNRNKIYRDYMRTVMREADVDLEKVLGKSVSKIGTGSRVIDSSFRKELTTYAVAAKNELESGRITLEQYASMDKRNSIDSLLSDPSRIDRAMSFAPGTFNALDDQQKLIVTQFLRAEEIDLKMGLAKGSGMVSLTEWYKAGLSPTLGTTRYVDELELAKVAAKNKAFRLPAGSPDYANFEHKGNSRLSYVDGDLRHMANQELSAGYVISTTFEAKANKLVRDAIEKKSVQIRDETYNTLLATHSPADASMLADYAKDQYIADETNKAKKRLKAAKLTADMGNDLFAAATTKEILENIQAGKYFTAVFGTSRAISTLPFIDKRLRSIQNWGAAFTPGGLVDTLPPALRPIAKTYASISVMGEKIAENLGIRFEVRDSSDLKGIPKLLEKTGLFDSRVSIEWEVKDAVGNPANKFNFHTVKGGQGFGIYDAGKGLDDFGAFTLIQKIESEGFADKLSHYGFNAQEMFEDFTKLDDFYQRLDDTKQLLLSSGGVGPFPAAQQEFIDFMAEAGLFTRDPNTGLISLGDFASLDKVFQGKSIFDANGRKMLEELSDASKFGANIMHPKDRWAWLEQFGASGRAAQFKTQYTGLLDSWNRGANAIRNYIYKNLIFGETLTSMPVIGSMYAPVQKFIKRLGFSDERGLSQVIRTWKPIRKMRMWGKMIQRAALGDNLALPVLSKIPVMAKLLSNKALALTIAKILGAAAGIFTGGISYVITFAGGTIWKVTKSLMRFDLRGAGNAIKDDVVSLINLVKKIVIYPFFVVISIPCGCCGIIVALIIALIGGMIAPYEPLSAGLSGRVDSELIRVTKTEESTGFAGIRLKAFKIVVQNISTQTVTIGRFDDNLSMVTSCDSGGQVISYGSSGFIGKLVNTENDSITPQWISTQFVGQTIPAGESIELVIYVDLVDYFNELNAGTLHHTYYNSVEVGTVEESGRTAIASENIPVGNGGCARCPSGWPVCAGAGTCPVTVTQGPNGSYSHSGVEAIDFGNVGRDSTIYATHDGTARIGTGCGEGDAYSTCNGGYGNFVEVISELGFRSMYAHLSGILVNAGDPIIKGQEIGISGSTGNSTGPHLHYEFRKSGGRYPECHPGQPVTMNPPYVPYRPAP